ncbi:MAG: type III pantothenate kinase [Gemmatimonadota bacterium]
MHLVVDVGNTETMMGLFRPGEIEPLASWRYSTRVPRTADELLHLVRAFLREDGFADSEVERTVVGSVVPAQTELLRRALSSIGRGTVLVVEHGSPIPIRLDVEEPRTVGADRIVNTLAAARLFGKDTIVVDLGTATTFDCITSDGVFVGGVISPGLQAGQDWLTRQTAKLPGVELRPPERVIGRRTETCLQSGIFYSAVDAVDGIVDRIRAEWDRPDAFVVATGGFAEVVARHSRTVEEAVPYLTLVGLELAGRYMAGDPDPGLHSEA